MKRQAFCSRKVGAGLFALIFSLALIGAWILIVAKAEHHCTGEDCPHCACIRQCEQNLEVPLLLTAVGAAVIHVFYSRREPFRQAAASSCAWTLIGLKVRMNN